MNDFILKLAAGDSPITDVFGGIAGDAAAAIPGVVTAAAPVLGVLVLIPIALGVLRKFGVRK